MTWGEYSHTAIILSDTEIIEAWQGCNKVRVISSLSEGHTKGTPVDIYNIELTEEEEERAVQFIRKQVGKKYDYFGILGFILRRGTQSQGKWFCSELCSATLNAAGVPLLKRIADSKVSPTLIGISPLLTLTTREVTV